MVMGEGFSQVSNDDTGNGGDDGEDRKDENTSKKLWNCLHPPPHSLPCGHCSQFPYAASLGLNMMMMMTMLMF